MSLDLPISEDEVPVRYKPSAGSESTPPRLNQDATSGHRRGLRDPDEPGRRELDLCPVAGVVDDTLAGLVSNGESSGGWAARVVLGSGAFEKNNTQLRHTERGRHTGSVGVWRSLEGEWSAGCGIGWFCPREEGVGCKGAAVAAKRQLEGRSPPQPARSPFIRFSLFFSSG